MVYNHRANESAPGRDRQHNIQYHPRKGVWERVDTNRFSGRIISVPTHPTDQKYEFNRKNDIYREVAAPPMVCTEKGGYRTLSWREWEASIRAQGFHPAFDADSLEEKISGKRAGKRVA